MFLYVGCGVRSKKLSSLAWFMELLVWYSRSCYSLAPSTIRQLSGSKSWWGVCLKKVTSSRWQPQKFWREPLVLFCLARWLVSLISLKERLCHAAPSLVYVSWRLAHSRRFIVKFCQANRKTNPSFSIGKDAKGFFFINLDDFQDNFHFL